MTKERKLTWFLVASTAAFLLMGLFFSGLLGVRITPVRKAERDPYEVMVENEMWKSPVLGVCQTAIVSYKERTGSWPKTVNDIIPPEGIVKRFGKSRQVVVTRANLKIAYLGVDEEGDRLYNLKINGWETNLVVEEGVKKP